MGIYDQSAWGVIIGLALMLIGGLVMWAYAGRRDTTVLVPETSGPEVEATRRFHTKLTRWFFLYGCGVTVLGALLLIWGSLTILG